jgi:hypothetical protein
MSIRRVVFCVWAGSLCAASLAAAAPALELSQILAKNAEARGGLDAWRKVQDMVWSGHVERADRKGVALPFMFEQKRPNLTRFELVMDKQRAVRVFDGSQGWKVRPDATGRPQVQPYTDEERRAAGDALVIDGPVLDASAKGVQLALDGVDEVDGRKAWRLRTTLPSGTTQRVWIDAESFLDVKYERPGRDAAGRPASVAVYLRNYQTFDGLKIPFSIETGTPAGEISDRLVIERIAINAHLPDGMFARPGLRTARRGITVETRVPPPSQNTARRPAR